MYFVGFEPCSPQPGQSELLIELHLVGIRRFFSRLWIPRWCGMWNRHSYWLCGKIDKIVEKWATTEYLLECELYFFKI